MNALLKRLFDDTKSQNDVQRFVDEQRAEDLYIEFKQKHDRRHGNLDDDDRRNFSRALSGFANADGGILLFGVATKKLPDQIDRAEELKPITDVGRFCVKLRDSVLSTTQPPIDNVLIEVIPGIGSEGYLKCLIPASDKPPHMAMGAGGLYWRRTSNCFRSMEHFELEDMFGRRQRPALKIFVRLDVLGGPQHCEHLKIFLSNEGRAVAKYAGFHCELGDSSISKLQVITSPLVDTSQHNADRRTLGFDDAIGVIHPNGILRACGVAYIERGNHGKELPLTFTIYAEHMRAKRLAFTLAPGTFVAAG
jgi:hypothetical protein